jgi:arylamine N-acetyltransferase
MARASRANVYGWHDTTMAEDGFDVASYLRRLDYPGPTDPTFDTLAAVVSAHNRSIPFENLDPLLGTPVFDLSAEALMNKLVHRRRGGYCYEHNGLLRYALQHLGFGASPLAGRVVWMNPGGLSGALPAQTHNALAVSVPGTDTRFLVDVGFGGQTLSSPIRLETGVIQQTRHEPYRITEHGARLLLESAIRGSWEPLYLFTTRPQPLIDLQVGSWYVSTHPGSTFTTGLTAALVTDDARVNMRGRNLAIHRGGETEKIRFETAADVLDALTNRFGIDITGLGDLEGRVSEVLDT